MHITSLKTNMNQRMKISSGQYEQNTDMTKHPIRHHHRFKEHHHHHMQMEHERLQHEHQPANVTEMIYETSIYLPFHNDSTSSQSQLTTEMMMVGAKNYSAGTATQMTVEDCYSTNQVLMIIGITCCLNFAFVITIMALVQCFGGGSKKYGKRESEDEELLGEEEYNIDSMEECDFMSSWDSRLRLVSLPDNVITRNVTERYVAKPAPSCGHCTREDETVMPVTTPEDSEDDQPIACSYHHSNGKKRYSPLPTDDLTFYSVTTK